MSNLPSGSQTVGPFFSIGLLYLCGNCVVPSAGKASIEVFGRLLDERLAGITDAVIEIWQADERGNYLAEDWNEPGADPRDIPGFVRVATDDEGQFSFTTVKPGPVPYDDDRMQAPHLVVLIFMRGLLRNLVTRMYFPDEPLSAADPVLGLIPEDRRDTLVARKAAGSSGLEWTIITRGEAETAFFEW
jgi:protocatechuate 3,4-dioxygenase, alpha subunit